MRVIKAIGSFIKNFMIVFSFIVNLVLLVIVLALVLLIFDIKNNVVTPLVAGLHSSFVGLDESTIDWTIPVRDNIPVVLNIPLQTDTVVVLTEPVPVSVTANITLPGVGELNNAQVFLSLPAGLELPVRLDLNVPVNEDLDVSLDVRAVIPVSETQLHDPINNLRLVFEPLTRGLYNLPDDFNEAGTMVGEVLAGNSPNLLVDNAYSLDPWPGFSRTAGLGYTLGTERWPEGNTPVQTGIVQVGGIPALDQQLRPDVWAAGGPAALNVQAADAMLNRAVPLWMFDGSYALFNFGAPSATRAQAAPPGAEVPVESTVPPIETPAAPTLDPSAPLPTAMVLGVPETPTPPPLIAPVPTDASAPIAADVPPASSDDLGILPTPEG